MERLFERERHLVQVVDVEIDPERRPDEEVQISVKEVRPDRRGIVGLQLEREGDGAVSRLHGLTQCPRADAREAMRRHGTVGRMRAEPGKTQLGTPPRIGLSRRKKL